MNDRAKNIKTLNMTKNAGNLPYSIHTVEYRAILTKIEYNCVKNALAEYCNKHSCEYFRDKDKENFKKYIFKLTEIFGFTAVNLCRNDFTAWLDIKINPRRMFHKNDCPFAYIATIEEHLQAYAKIADFLAETKCDRMIKLAFFRVQRVDFCINIDLGSEDNADEYLRLLRKGRYPHYYTRLREYSTSGKRMVDTKDSFTIKCCSKTFSVYAKHRQLEKAEYLHSPQDEEAAVGMLRLEVRIERGNVTALAKKYECEDVFALLSQASEIAQKEFERIIKFAFGSGNFVNLETARKMVARSNFKDKTKLKMQELLLILTKQTLGEVYNDDSENVAKLMQKFNEIGISPITIPRRSQRRFFANPLKYIENRSKNYPEQIKKTAAPC